MTAACSEFHAFSSHAASEFQTHVENHPMEKVFLWQMSHSLWNGQGYSQIFHRSQKLHVETETWKTSMKISMTFLVRLNVLDDATI